MDCLILIKLKRSKLGDEIIMTCYEHLRKAKQNRENFDRLQSYFHALENNTLDEYHKKHGRNGEL